jgi:dihydrofolate reductase
MGRKTYESIGRALPGRVNVVITSNSDAVFDGAVTVTSVEDAIVAAGDVDEVMIIGGGTIYQTCLASANRLYLTFIDLEVKGDTFFPDFEQASAWREVERTKHLADDKNPYNYEFVTFDRAL